MMSRINKYILGLCRDLKSLKIWSFYFDDIGDLIDFLCESE